MGTTKQFRLAVQVLFITLAVWLTSLSPTVLAQTQSSDATLSALTLSEVDIGTFASSITSYTASVANRVRKTTVTPTVNHSGASHVIKLGDLEDADGEVSLSVGSNVITIEVTAEDGQTIQTYTVTVTRAENTPATGAPTISGTLEVGGTLTADLSGISDANGLTNATFSYQWVTNDGSSDTDMEGATHSTYTLLAADLGKTLKVRVSFTDDGGNEETLTSEATPAVEAWGNDWDDFHGDTLAEATFLRAGLVGESGMQSGTVGPASDVDYFQVVLDGERAGYIYFDFDEWADDESSLPYARVAILDAEGECVAQYCTQSWHATYVVLLPEPGTYYVRVDTSQQSDLSSHRYAISWFPERFRTTEMLDCAAIETDGDDPYYGCQNNLFNQIHNGEDINVKPAWAAGVYGAGVNVVVVEQSGVDPNHPDLAGTVDKTQSATAGDDLPLTDFPSSHRTSEHGTKMVGIIAAQHNSIGTRGVAPEANIIAYRVRNFETDAAAALLHTMKDAAVYNNSWGLKNVKRMRKYRHHFEDAILQGVSEGYDGKGSVYVFGVPGGLNSNFSDLENFYAVLPVCKVSNRGEVTLEPEAEQFGENLWVCAPAPSYSTTPIGLYRRSTGSSASTAMVSGVVALVRSVNPDLTWRDVKLLLAGTARKNHSQHGSWASGALKYGSESERYNFSPHYGFGVVDAGAAVAAAADWGPLPPMLEVSAKGDGLYLHDLPAMNELTVELPWENDTPAFIEHVEVKLDLKHSNPNDLSMELISPSGTVAQLLRMKPFESYGGVVGLYSLGASRFLGEDPTGVWTLRVQDDADWFDDGKIKSWELIVRGHRKPADWEAILTVGKADNYSPAAYGYSSIVDIGGSLSAANIVLDGEECPVSFVAIHVGDLYFGVDCEIPTGFTLFVDDQEFASTDASVPAGVNVQDAYMWSAAGLSWEENQEVSLALVSEDGERSELAAPPLTAFFSKVPDQHNGSTAFTFRLNFSEGVATTAEALRNHVLSITGGAVSSVKAVGSEGKIWAISVKSESTDTVSVVVEAGPDCELPDAICTADGRRLSDHTELKVSVRHNNPATGVPTISGKARVGETLMADTSGIGDGLDNTTFTYQWAADDADIAGATDSTYTLVDADLGRTITVRVSFTDDAGNHESLTSQATEPVTAKPNSQATGLPIIVGNVQVGETLTADTSGITDEDGLTSAVFKYEWLANDAVIAGANDSSYIISDSDREMAVRVRVSFTDDRGFDERLTSNPVGLDRPYELTASILEGGVVLTWKPPVVFPYLYDYQVLHNRPELGETEPIVYADTGTAETTYTDTEVEPGALYVYRVKAANYFNRLSQASEPVEIRTPQSVPTANSPATGAPTISGTAQVGETLTANTSGIADEDGLTNATFSYQWLADDADIGGATNASYALTDSDEGKTVKVTVTFTDDAGNEESVTSAATDAVASSPTTLTASIRDAPDSHDGENSFTFELRFSEEPEPDFSYEALRDHAFTATGGTVTSVTRSPRSSRTYRIAPAKSASFDTTTACSYSPLNPSTNRRVARFTSDPFSSKSLTRTCVGSPRHRLGQRAPLDAGAEDPVVGVEARHGRQGSQIYELPLSLPRVAGTRVEPGREVADPVDGVFREERLGQLPQVEPPERGVLQGAVAEIEAVDVNVGDQSLLPYKDRDRQSGRSRPYRRIDRGGVRTLPRSGGGCQQDL